MTQRRPMSDRTPNERRPIDGRTMTQPRLIDGRSLSDICARDRRSLREVRVIDGRALTKEVGSCSRALTKEVGSCSRVLAEEVGSCLRALAEEVGSCSRVLQKTWARGSRVLQKTWARGSRVLQKGFVGRRSLPPIPARFVICCSPPPQLPRSRRSAVRFARSRHAIVYRQIRSISSIGSCRSQLFREFSLPKKGARAGRWRGGVRSGRCGFGPWARAKFLSRRSPRLPLRPPPPNYRVVGPWGPPLRRPSPSSLRALPAALSPPQMLRFPPVPRPALAPPPLPMRSFLGRENSRNTVPAKSDPFPLSDSECPSLQSVNPWRGLRIISNNLFGNARRGRSPLSSLLKLRWTGDLPHSLVFHSSMRDVGISVATSRGSTSPSIP